MKNIIKFRYKIFLGIFIILMCLGIQTKKNEVSAGMALPNSYIYIKIDNIDDEDIVKVLYKDNETIIDLKNNIQGIYTLGPGYDGEKDFFTVLIDKGNEIIQSDIMSATYDSKENNGKIDIYYDANEGKHISKFVFILNRFLKSNFVKIFIYIIISNIVLIVVLNRFKSNRKRKIMLYIISICFQAVLYFGLHPWKNGILLPLSALSHGEFDVALFATLIFILPIIGLDLVQYYICKHCDTDLKTRDIIKLIVVNNLTIILLIICLNYISYK